MSEIRVLAQRLRGNDKRGIFRRGGSSIRATMGAFGVLLAVFLVCSTEASNHTLDDTNKNGDTAEESGSVYRIWPLEASETTHAPSNRARDMNYPVKITRKFLDSEGNVRVVTIYGSRNDPALPIFDERIVTGHTGRSTNKTQSPTKPTSAQGTRKVVFPVRKRPAAKRTEPSSVQDIIAAKTPLEAAGTSHWAEEPENYEFVPTYGGSEKSGHGYREGGSGGGGGRVSEAFDKGSHREHGHEDKGGVVKGVTGEKQGHIDEANSYSEGQQASIGDTGSKKLLAKGHKKGRKTTGFHSVHHKDEYKKDEVFYDEDSSTDEEEGHELGRHSYRGEQGAAGKAGHLDSGFNSATEGHHAGSQRGQAYDAEKAHVDHSHSQHNQGYNKGYKDSSSYRVVPGHGHYHG